MYQSSLITDAIPKPPEKPIIPTGNDTDKAQAPKAWWGDSSPAKSDDNYTPPPIAPLNTSKPMSRSAALNSLSQTYRSVYDCTDELKLSRPQCSIIFSVPHPDWQYVPCSTYRNLPPYDEADTEPMIDALIKIPSNTPQKLVMEIAWYASVIKKLQEGIDAGANPPSSPPPAPGDDSGKTYSSNPDGSSKGAAAGAALLASLGKKPTVSEGFFSEKKCSPEQIAAKREAMRAKRKANLEKSSASCSVPSIRSEIDRINAILNNGEFMEAMSKCNAIYSSAMKLKSDVELLKAGNLYEWQKSGPAKTYNTFNIKKKGAGYDRLAALKESLLQNKDFNF